MSTLIAVNSAVGERLTIGDSHCQYNLCIAHAPVDVLLAPTVSCCIFTARCLWPSVRLRVCPSHAGIVFCTRFVES